MNNPLAIIPIYITDNKALDLTRKCLLTLASTAPTIDIMPIDDGSPRRDLVNELARECAVNGVTLLTKKNEGFSKTVNVGLELAEREGRDAILINADIEFFEEGWLEAMDNTDAYVVGAKLLFPNGLIQHAGIYYCQPPDDLILTGTDGYVPISELDNSVHKLVAYSKREDKIHRCITNAGMRVPNSGRSVGGYSFEVTSNHYEGSILELVSNNNSVRVTPNHKIPVRWNERALASYAVYLMKRGTNWRVGTTRVHKTTNSGGVFSGLASRMNMEKADALWILELCDTQNEALFKEALIAWHYGVPDIKFIHDDRGRLNQEILDVIWSELSVQQYGLNVLADYGRELHCPLIWKEPGVRNYPIGRRRRYTIVASNLMPGYMNLCVDPGAGNRAVEDEFTITTHYYDGDVFSIDVPPYHHYISDNIIVHNSILHRNFDHRYRFAPARLPEADIEKKCPVTSALQLIRHEALTFVGTYDESFELGFEDVDYCIRTFELGRECRYQPKARAIHHEQAFRGGDPEQNKKGQRGYQQLYSKHAGTSFIDYIPTMLGDDPK